MAWIWPSVCKTISQPYGRKNARYAKGYHTGIDIACPNGSPVRAVADGTITFAGWNGAYGNQVRQKIGGAEVWYNHFSSIRVKKGDGVSQGTIVGHEGSTGMSTGPHLHFEVRINGKDVDPMPYLGGSKVVPATAGDAEQVGITNPLEGLKNVKEFFDLLTDPVTWLRVGMFLGGGALLVMGLYMLSGQAERATQAAKMAVNIIPQGRALKAATAAKAAT